MGYTGIKDDYGNKIKVGDTIEWIYYLHGVMVKEPDGSEYFLACVTGADMITKRFVERRKITYEVRDEVAGYFLDRPTSIGMTFIDIPPKGKVVK